MCGIAALVTGRDDATARIEALTSALAHRGPDRSAYVVSGAVALGHTRLRVVDPRPEADQPMTIGDHSLVFSGAIINHRDLRRELARDHAVAFRTTSDTEVLFHALRVFDEHALERIEGMFSFVYYDARRRRVLAARDRIGIKPLVWSRCPDGAILLASEAQAIVRHAGIDRSVDRTALRQLLRFNHPLGEHTFFEQVKSLEPGCVMTIDVATRTLRVRRWWSFHLAPGGESVAGLDAAFRQAVERASDVDVAYGRYLSGGVDSSGIVAELVHDGRRPRLYSLVLPGSRCSEERHVDRVTEALGTRAAKVSIASLRLEDFVAYALRSEMPQWWTSDLALGELARRARHDGTRVVLSGEGPDELFAGYDVYRIAPLRPLLTRAGAIVGPTSAAMPFVRRLVPWLDVDTSIAAAYVASHHPQREREIRDHFGFHPENLALWETLEARRPLLDRDDAAYRAWERAYFRDRHGKTGLGHLADNLHFEIAERLPRWILHMGDRMASTHGVELRFPYLDDRFVDAAARVPIRTDKRILRRMHAQRLPRAIARRRKQPLYTPTRAWLGPVLSDPDLARYCSRAAFDRAGLLDFDVCNAARARLTTHADALTSMVDEWLFTFALTTSILATDLCGG